MEPKDTVMTQEAFDEWCGSHQIKGCGKKRDMCETVCRPLAQAEITGKIMKQEGIKEVVETYKREKTNFYDLDKSWWQAFLKSKGIE